MREYSFQRGDICILFRFLDFYYCFCSVLDHITQERSSPTKTLLLIDFYCNGVSNSFFKVLILGRYLASSNLFMRNICLCMIFLTIFLSSINLYLFCTVKSWFEKFVGCFSKQDEWILKLMPTTCSICMDWLVRFRLIFFTLSRKVCFHTKRHWAKNWVNISFV